MSEKTFNGWKNYETWNVNLWMQQSDSYWDEIAQEVYDNAEESEGNSREENAIYALSHRLKDEHEEFLPELQGFAADLLNAAMSEVDWSEIAEHWIDEVDKDSEIEVEETELAI